MIKYQGDFEEIGKAIEALLDVLYKAAVDYLKDNEQEIIKALELWEKDNERTMEADK